MLARSTIALTKSGRVVLAVSITVAMLAAIQSLNSGASTPSIAALKSRMYWPMLGLPSRMVGIGTT
jgi:hypothetical protein